MSIESPSSDQVARQESDWLDVERISRSYFWLFLVIFNTIAFLYGGIVGIFFSDSAQNLNIVWTLISAVLAVYVNILRMHDVNKSGWFSLIPIYGQIVMLFKKGDSGENDYGPAPIRLSPRKTKIVAGILIFYVVLMIIYYVSVITSIFHT